MNIEWNLSARERQLIAAISLELARNGGSCRAIPLKDFAGDKKVDSLLEGKKFLSFLEGFPEIFEVNRSSQLVTLKSSEFVLPRSGQEEEQRKCVAEANLEQRVIYVLRQLEAKRTRRQKQRKSEGKVEERPGASLDWLVTKCWSHLHKWMRLIRCIDEPMDHTQICHDANSKLDIFLRDRHHIFHLDKEGKFFKWKLIGIDLDDDGLSELANELVMASVAGGVSLSQLLHFNTTLRQRLGGRDLRMLIDTHPRIFQEVTVFHDEKGHVYVKKNSTQFSGRLEVDEVAQFSMTASKHSAAMATSIFQAIIQKVEDSNGIIAVDMTAGAGGLTLALAKRFDTVLAIEIDAARAELCRKNMKSQGLNNVTVVCADAMEYTLLTMNFTVPLVLIIDPPWGGLNYRRDCQNIGLGEKWPLAVILTALAHRLVVFCVGLKLPVTFDVDKLIEEANYRCDESRFIKINSIKKLGPQLFVVLETSSIAISRSEI